MKLSELSTGQVLLIGSILGAALYRAAQLFAPWHLGTCHGCGSRVVCDVKVCPRFYPSLGVRVCGLCGNERQLFVRPSSQRIACWVCLRIPDPETGLHEPDVVCNKEGFGKVCERIAEHNGPHAKWVDNRVRFIWDAKDGMDLHTVPPSAHGEDICGERDELGFQCEAAKGHAARLHVFGWDDSDMLAVWRSGERSRLITRANSFIP